PHFWPKSDREPILPPRYTRPAGRPKKLRGKDPIEDKKAHKAKRRYGPTKCKNCGDLGHNKRTCKTTRDNQEGEPSRGAGSLPRPTFPNEEQVVTLDWAPSRHTVQQHRINPVGSGNRGQLPQHDPSFAPAEHMSLSSTGPTRWRSRWLCASPSRPPARWQLDIQNHDFIVVHQDKLS
ncbi:Unknown protein, partial [Striga hermonthica]